MGSYYNDNDPFMCEWIGNLIAAGELPRGIVDGRSITEVLPDGLKAFTQCHFFAGTGGGVRSSISRTERRRKG